MQRHTFELQALLATALANQQLGQLVEPVAAFGKLRIRFDA
jgi:hypothetical protein